MANKKTSQYDALPGGVVNDTWLFDIAEAAVKNYKGTSLEVKNYFNLGQAGGRTIEGGTAAAENLILESTSHGTKGFIGLENLQVSDEQIAGSNVTVIADSGTLLLDSQGILNIQADSSMTINPDKADADITIKSPTSENLMFYDMGNDRIGLLTATPSVAWEVAGSTKISAGTFALATGTTVNEIVTTVDVSSTDDQLATAKAIWDAVGVENLWDRVPGLPNYLVPHTAADELGNASAPIAKGWFTSLSMQGDLTFASGEFSLVTGTKVNEIVTTVDASSTDDQLATAKAVHDSATAIIAKRDNLTISTPGQTAFTLSQIPSGTDSFGLFLNGNQVKDTDYSFVGTSLTYSGTALKTTDRLLAWYDWQAPSAGILPQEQIYYWGDAGSDTNDGKTMPTAFKTLTKALSEAVAQTPSSSNQFLLYGIGAMIETGDHTIPSWITVHAPGIQMTGEWTFQDDSSANIKRAIPATGKISCKKIAGTGTATVNILEKADVSAVNGNLMQCTSGILTVNVNGMAEIENGNLDHETTAISILNINGDIIRTAAGKIMHKSASNGEHHISYKRLISTGVAGSVFYTAPATTGHNLYLDIGYSSIANNNTIFLDLTTTNVFGKVGYTRLNGTTSKFHDLQSNSTTALIIDQIAETTPSTADSSSDPSYVNLLNPNGHTEFKNDGGQHVFTGLGNSGYAYFGGITGGYIGQKFKNYSGTMPAAGSNLVVTAATLGLSDARQIVEVYLTVHATDNLWVKDGNNLLGITHKFDVSIPAVGHVSAGDLIITSHTGATSIGGQPFELSYKYQFGNYLN